MPDEQRVVFKWGGGPSAPLTGESERCNHSASLRKVDEVGNVNH